jgi:hypothetical protein
MLQSIAMGLRVLGYLLGLARESLLMQACKVAVCLPRLWYIVSLSSYTFYAQFQCSLSHPQLQ